MALLLPILLLVLLFVLLSIPQPEPSEDAADDVAAVKCDSLFEFDPNTADYRQLRALGLSQVSAAAVVKRQRRNYPISIKEEFATIYGIDDSLYYRLEPYIVIAEKYRPKPYEHNQIDYGRRRGRAAVEYRPFLVDTASAAYFATLGFSVRQAEAIVRYRDMRGGFRSLAEFAECYVVDPKICDTLSHYMIFGEQRDSAAVRRLVEINTADSAELRSVRGIGDKSVAAILAWREKAGGFTSVVQLAEEKLVSESNFEKILPQICCDTCKISKIDINFATQTRLNEHPYIRPVLRRLIRTRQLKGGWSRIEEMIEDKIFDEREAERLRPYLRFARESE